VALGSPYQDALTWSTRVLRGSAAVDYEDPSGDRRTYCKSERKRPQKYEHCKLGRQRLVGEQRHRRQLSTTCHGGGKSLVRTLIPTRQGAPQEP
jgi:hypothetical protein